MKKNLTLIFGSIFLITIVAGGSIMYVSSKRNNQEELALNLTKSPKENIIKQSPYTLEELYEFTKNKSWPEDSIEIYENWYDYFSSETPFINAYGDSWNYDEYMKLKERFSSDFFYRINSSRYGMWNENNEK